MLKSKVDAPLSIQNFVSFTETKFGAEIKTIRTNNETEFSMNSYFASKGIIHQTTCIETP